MESKSSSEVRITISFSCLEREPHSWVIGSTWQGPLMPRLCLCLNFCVSVPSQTTLGAQEHLRHGLLPLLCLLAFRHDPSCRLLLQAPVFSPCMRLRLRRDGSSSCIEPSTASHAGARISTLSRSSSSSPGWSRWKNPFLLIPVIWTILGIICTWVYLYF